MLQRILEQAGRLLPESKRFPTERRLRGWLEQQRLDRADYAVVSFGKSGRTWLRVMISRIYQRRHGLSEELIEYSNYHRANPALPRVLFTHDNYLRDYTGHGGGKAAFTKKPVLLLVRHPADITMSQYFQWKHRMRPHKVLLNQYPPVDDSVTEYDFMMGSSGLPKVNAWLNEWAVALDSLESSLVVRYEDMRSNTQVELRRIADFMGMKATDEEVADAVEWARFENMKQRESEASSSSDRLRAADVSNPDSFKTRRAKVGGYQDYFDDAQVEAIADYIDRTLDPRFGYSRADRRSKAR
jgi:sulfotransferase family protein